jgi:DNA-binding CsgD family transcriptional regulator
VEDLNSEQQDTNTTTDQPEPAAALEDAIAVLDAEDTTVKSKKKSRAKTTRKLGTEVVAETKKAKAAKPAKVAKAPKAKAVRAPKVATGKKPLTQRERAYEMIRKGGATKKEIAATLGCTTNGAWGAIYPMVKAGKVRGMAQEGVREQIYVAVDA